MTDTTAPTPPYVTTTSLNKIRATNVCRWGWKAGLQAFDKKTGDDDPIELIDLLDRLGYDNSIWVMAFAPTDDRIGRHLQAWCIETLNPTDKRVLRQIEMLRNDRASPAERAEALWEAYQALSDATSLTEGLAARAAVWTPEEVLADGRFGPRDVAVTWAAGAAYSRQEAQLRKMLATPKTDGDKQ